MADKYVHLYVPMSDELARDLRIEAAKANISKAALIARILETWVMEQIEREKRSKY